MKVGQKVQAKIKNRWVNVVVKKINKTNIRVTQSNSKDISLIHKLVRTKPVVKKTVKKPVTKSTKPIGKPRKTVPKVDTPVVKVGRPGTKKNPWIPLADLRSCNAISNLDYETKVKFEAIIISLIKDS